jgi:hypothetical protein
VTAYKSCVQFGFNLSNRVTDTLDLFCPGEMYLYKAGCV